MPGPFTTGSQPEAVPPGLPTWAVELRKAAEIDQYLGTRHGCLPPDVIAKLREAADKGMDDHLAEVARKLSALRGLGLDDDQIRDHVIGARDYMFGTWAEKRVAKGTLTRRRLTAPGPPQCRRAHSLAAWGCARQEGRVGQARHGTGQAEPRGTSRTGNAQPSSTPDREPPALLANPMWSVSRTTATNADLVGLCEEFPAMRPNRVRRHLIDAYAGLASSTSAVIAGPIFSRTRAMRSGRSWTSRANKTKAGGPAQPRHCGPEEHAAQSNDDTTNCSRMSNMKHIASRKSRRRARSIGLRQPGLDDPRKFVTAMAVDYPKGGGQSRAPHSNPAHALHGRLARATA